MNCALLLTESKSETNYHIYYGIIISTYWIMIAIHKLVNFLHLSSRPTKTLQWRHNERGGVSTHRRLECLPSRLFTHRSKKTSKLRATGLCEGNSPGIHRWPIFSSIILTTLSILVHPDQGILDIEVTDLYPSFHIHRIPTAIDAGVYILNCTFNIINKQASISTSVYHRDGLVANVQCHFN